MKKKKFWLSWHQPTDDYRPIQVPPVNIVKGYWCSGYTGDTDVAIMCAWVLSGSEEEAKKIITKKKYWPEAEDWRFCSEKPDDWEPGDRFPMRTSGNAKE